MTLSEANKWYHTGDGDGVYMDFTKIVLPKSVTVDAFNQSKLRIQGSKAIVINFAGKSFVNPDQALVYGSITLVLIDKNTVWAMPDKYDFDIKNKPGTLGRDMATAIGQAVSEFGYTTPGQAFPIYFIGYQTIPEK